ncbi:MAG: hypothetical protein MHM6MM_005128 [Cercozoa sp. M6MM]
MSISVACSRSNSGFDLIPKLPILLCVLWTIKMSVSLRNAPPESRESFYLQVIVALSLATLVVTAIVRGVLKGDANAVALIEATGSFLTILFVLGLYTLPRVLCVHFGWNYATPSTLLSSEVGTEHDSNDSAAALKERNFADSFPSEIVHVRPAANRNRGPESS